MVRAPLFEEIAFRTRTDIQVLPRLLLGGRTVDL